MLPKLSKKPLTLKIGDQNLKFNSADEIEFALEGRISISTEKIMELMQLTSEQLQEELVNVNVAESKLEEVLLKAIEDPNSIDGEMRGLNKNIFTQDHRWRDIMLAINQSQEEWTPFRRIILLRYMKYLSSKKDLINHLLTAGKRMEQESLSATLNVEPVQSQAEPAASVVEDGSEELKRLTKGEPVTIHLTKGMEINLSISAYQCKIKVNDHVEFIDHTGCKYILKEGRNKIGRDPTSEIVLDRKLRDVSRLHLLIENYDNRILQLTDMSSTGTSIPSQYL